MRGTGRLFVAWLGALLVMAGTALPALSAATEAVFPATQWQRVASPESAGYSPQKLAALRTYLESIDTAAMMVVVGGRSLFEYGDVAQVSVLASARKSVMAMLYGKYVQAGMIRLDRSLEDLGIDDVGGLSAAEKQATIEQLLTARSGIYHPAANPGDDTAHAPPRGSVAPGSKHLYNNWDFNAAGTVFEQLTRRDIYDALATDLALPIGMQDFDRARQRKTGNLQRSRHPAYHMQLSTRDMARLGLLMLHDGRWQDKAVMPAGWAARITRLVTPYEELIPERKSRLGAGQRWGYGYLWWVWDAAEKSGLMEGAYTARDIMDGAYTARGLGGQFITVLPQLDMVIAHKTITRNSDASRRRKAVSSEQYATVLRLVIAARCAAAGC